MAVTAGALSQLSVGDTFANLNSAPATAGVGPYTYQWYRSTSSGFSPGGGNIISGATALLLEDTGLIPTTQYYYKVVATDTGDSNATSTSAQLAVATTTNNLSPNQFAESPLLGMVDLRFPYNTVAVQVDASQSQDLYPGCAVKMVDSAGGVPKVVGCSANSDQVLGFINFNMKNRKFRANDAVEISMSGNVMYLYATGAIARGARVVLSLSSAPAPYGGVAEASGSGGERIVGWAYDKSTGSGQLIRVFIQTPSFAVDA